VRYGEEPPVQLYFLDHNASLPEAPGIWIHGRQRADIILRSQNEFETITVTARSPIATEVSVDVGRGQGVMVLEPGVQGTVTVEAAGVYSRKSWAYLMQIRTSDGFVPRLVEPGSGDGRFLGAAISLRATPAAIQ
ncbi:MAG: hypothetical protein CL484_12720, partial [Acidobacteria bacterium]|nr:hypothetical protein [Acidobacteriota bacterium]